MIFYNNEYVKNVVNLLGIYVICILLHYISSQLYIYLCTPANFYGFLISPFLAPTLHCQAMRWCIYNCGNNITHMWITVGVWFAAKLIIK